MFFQHKQTKHMALLAASVLTLSAIPFVRPAAVTAADAIIAADFEDGENTVFTRRGETEELSVTTEEAHGGTHALMVTGREQGWNGPQVALDGVLQAGEEYLVTAYAKTPWYSQLTLSKQYNDTEGSTHYENILAATSDGAWVAYEDIKFSFPAGSTEMYIYFEAGDANVTIYVDDFSVSEAPFIEPENLPAIKDVYADAFKIGTALTPSDLGSKSMMALVEKHMNGCVTVGNELKPDYVLDKAGCLSMVADAGDDTDPQVTLASARPLLEYCSRNNIPVRGHCLVWHSQTPDWFFKENYEDDGEWVSKEKMLQRMENYIKNVMAALAKEFPRVTFYAWDVVNEAWSDDGKPRQAGSNNVSGGQSAWVSVFGDNSFIDYAFTYARAYAPKGCKLFYNDYNEYIDGKTNAMVEMATRLKEKGVIDGIGMQSHLDVSFPSASQYKNALNKFVATGLDVQVTELDVTTSDKSESGFKKQAEYYSDILDAIYAQKENVSAVIFWGVTDDRSWRASQVPLLFDAECKAKPAYYSITDGISYTTTETTTTTSGSSSGVPDVLKGDVDDSGKVDIADCILLNRFLAEDADVSITSRGLQAADVNGDGALKADDTTAIMKFIARLIPEL